MGRMTGWAGRTATEIAAAVRAGEVTAAAVAAEHLESITAHDPEVGAFVRVRAAEALKEAEAVDARPDRSDLRLAGVPVAIKDSVPVTGEPMRVGSTATPSLPQEADHPLVARLRAAGAVVVGLTNLPELAIYPFTDSAYGVTRNPWDLSRTAAGSSGGSAACVAAGMVPLAHGTDGLGSIRIPAAACGLFGLKPGPGMVPAIAGANDWHGLSESGPLATTVADAAVMLGGMSGCTFSLESPASLRIAMSVSPPGPGIVVHRSCADAVRESGGVLAELGHSVTETSSPIPRWLTPVAISYWLACPGGDAGPYLSRMQPRTRAHVRAGQLATRVRPLRGASDRERLRAALTPFFEQYDVLIMPTLAQPCPPAQRYGGKSWLRSAVLALRFAPMTGAWNLAGYPAASVPVPLAQASAAGADSPGMPGAVQLVATPGREDLLLSLAAQIEQANPWPRLAPNYSAANTNNRA
jgi:amidase